MLITPIQPHNSLNNIPIQIQERSSEVQPELNLNSKIQEIKSAGKKTQSLRSRKATARKSDVAVARKRLLLELKLQESIRKNASQKMNDMEVHKEELIQRKQLLADILKEYEQISKDKNVLTAEIKNMKKYLTDIRTKLDQSMSILNRNTTLIAMKGGIADSLFKSGKTKKVPAKKRKNKVEKSDKSEKSKDTFLTKESLLKTAVSALKVK